MCVCVASVIAFLPVLQQHASVRGRLRSVRSRRRLFSWRSIQVFDFVLAILLLERGQLPVTTVEETRRHHHPSRERVTNG
jgi:hypothetical protein